MPIRRSSRAAVSCFAEDPSRGFSRARILWSAEFDPGVLRVRTRRRIGRSESLPDWGKITIVNGAGIEHLLLSTASGPLRLDIVEGTVRDGPVDLTLTLNVDLSIIRQCDSIPNLLRHFDIAGAGRWRTIEDRRLPRLVEALRVGDALDDGASLREIAAALKCTGQTYRDWPGPGESTKSWVRRRVALARRLRRRGPAAVLQFSI